MSFNWGHVISIPSQPVFDVTRQLSVSRGKVTNTISIVFVLTRSGLELMIYNTRAITVGITLRMSLDLCIEPG
jgi:hypothetical protein